MAQETDVKIESILISCISRLYDKEANCGLDYDDLRCLEILFKIKSAANSSASSSPVSSPSAPSDLIELLRAARGNPSNDNGK